MFPHLLPCPTETIDLASPVAVMPWLASSVPGSPKAEVVPIDTDSEKDESFSPVTPKDRTWEPARLLRRELPHCPATRRVERAALCLLRCEDPPRKQDLMRLFSMLHPRELKISAFGTYVLAGASPRSRNILVTHTSKFPMFVMVVNKFLASVCPQHVFTSYVIRQGCFSKVHRDLQNGPTGAAVVALSHEARGEGLWIQDKVGNVPKEHAGGIVMGTVHSLRDPVLFDSRRLLHAGHITSCIPENRLILVAFSTLHASTMPWWIRDELLDLGFKLPTNFQIRNVTHGHTPHGEPPRLRQLTMREALSLPVDQRDDHEIITIHD